MRRILWIPALLAIGLVGCRDEDITGVRDLRPLLTQVSTGPVVNTTEDNSGGTCDDVHCTLREAIAFAEAGATITFAPGLTGTIKLLTGGRLEIGKNLTITGPGAASLTVRGDGYSWVFYVVPGATVSLSGLTITGGTNPGQFGGGIANSGTLTLSHCVITGNNGSVGGGGIHNGNGVLTLMNSTISGNQAGSGGGGGITIDGGTVTLINSTVSGNTASGPGGGIKNHYGALTLTNSTVSGNTISSGDGGGVYSNTDISNAAQHTTLLNSTISGNTSTNNGGGLHNGSGLMRIVLSTITGNQAAWSGGGVWSYNDGDTRSDVKGSLIWGNTLSGTSAPDNVAAETDPYPHTLYNSLGRNLIGAAGANVDFTLEFNAAGDQVNISSAGVGPLAANGGPTKTHALLTGSPALDVGTCTDHTGTTVTTDQRGISRPQGTTCDIGAFESEGTSGRPAPNFTFDLSALPAKTYGNGSFSVAGYMSTNSTGIVTFSLGEGSVGCSVTPAGLVTLTGAAAGTDYCIVTAFLYPDATYKSSGPLSQSFNIGKATLTVTAFDETMTYGGTTPSFGVGFTGFVGADGSSALSDTLSYTFAGTGGTTYGPSSTPPTNAGTYSITPEGLSAANYSFIYVPGTLTINKAAGSISINNLPSYGQVNGTFTPTYTKVGDGAASVSPSGSCTVSGGVVTFIAEGTCALQASLAEGTNHFSATGSLQNITVYPEFTKSCTYTINDKNDQRNVTITWANARPSVTEIQVSTTRTVKKAMAPTASGSWSTKVPSGTPTYDMWGGTSRRDTSTNLVSGGTCTRQTP